MKLPLCRRETRLFLMLMVLAMCLCSCVSSYSVQSTPAPDTYSYDGVNKGLEGRYAKIVLKNGDEISARQITISDNSVSWLNVRTGEQSRAGVTQVKKIILRNHFLGALEGLGWGFAGDGLTGLFVSSMAKATTLEQVQGLALGTVVGSGIGLITGAIIGHRYDYEFRLTEQDDSLQKSKYDKNVISLTLTQLTEEDKNCPLVLQFHVNDRVIIHLKEINGQYVHFRHDQGKYLTKAGRTGDREVTVAEIKPQIKNCVFGKESSFLMSIAARKKDFEVGNHDPGAGIPKLNSQFHPLDSPRYSAISGVITTPSVTDSLSDARRLPYFDIHFGIGIAVATRLGVRIQFHDHFSTEVFYGIPPGLSILGETQRVRAGFGINWHPWKSSSFVISLIETTEWNPYLPSVLPPRNKPFQYHLVSLSTGFLSMKSKGVNGFVRAGLGYEYFRTREGKHVYGFKVFNLDAGFGITF